MSLRRDRFRTKESLIRVKKTEVCGGFAGDRQKVISTRGFLGAADLGGNECQPEKRAGIFHRPLDWNQNQFILASRKKCVLHWKRYLRGTTRT